MDGAADSSAAFAALLTLATTNKCTLFVPPGTYNINEFVLSARPGVVIRGQGCTVSILKLRAARNADFVTLAGTAYTADGCGLVDIGFDGNASNQTGIWDMLKITTVTKGTHFENVYLTNGGNGLNVIGAPYAWKYLFFNFLIMHMTGSGILNMGTDNEFIGFTVGPTTLHNVVANGANCRVAIFKLMGSTTQSGMYISGGRLQLSDIDSQESYMHGVHIASGAYDVDITNLACDNNGFDYVNYVYGNPPPVKAVPDSYGLRIDSEQRISVLNFKMSNRNASYKYGLGAYYVGSGASDVTVQLTSERNPNVGSIDASINGINLIQSGDGQIVEKTTSFTLAAADFNKVLKINSTNAITITVPTEATLPTMIKRGVTRIVRYGTGTVTLVAASGNYVLTDQANLAIATRYGACDLYRAAADRWIAKF